MKHGAFNNERVTTALLLAAGTGSRLYPLTQNAPKCLTMVNGRSILERLISSLNLHGFNRLVVGMGTLVSVTMTTFSNWGFGTAARLQASGTVPATAANCSPRF